MCIGHSPVPSFGFGTGPPPAEKAVPKPKEVTGPAPAKEEVPVPKDAAGPPPAKKARHAEMPSFDDLIVLDPESAPKTRGAFTSRAYDETKRRCKKKGFPEDVVIRHARTAYAAAAKVHDEAFG